MLRHGVCAGGVGEENWESALMKKKFKKNLTLK